MKRSIISLTVFVLLVAFGTVSEITYTKSLATEIDSVIEDFNGEQSCEKLSSLFKSKETLNRLFLRENIIERFELYISELEQYVKANDKTSIAVTLEKIKYYSQDLHLGRTF